MQLILIIILILFSIKQSQEQQCVCECCLDDNINCIPTFRSAININPLLKCNNITCNQESCLTFSQCSTAFGKVVTLCEDIRMFPSTAVSIKFQWFFVILLFISSSDTF